jgi:hypothetical protein
VGDPDTTRKPPLKGSSTHAGLDNHFLKTGSQFQVIIRIMLPPILLPRQFIGRSAQEKLSLLHLTNGICG